MILITEKQKYLQGKSHNPMTCQ